ncbi:MAG TPA: ribonuclease III [Candidatus Polarisedimenticolaceae bacterium]
MSDREALERKLGHRFRDPQLLERALTHRSRAHEAATGEGSYERLEFLGDSLLGFLVADWLMATHPDADEGELTRRKQAIVSTGPLAQAARDLGLGEELRLGRGEEETGGRDKTSLLADVFEAVLAAVYHDGGIRAARAFVRRHLKGRVASVRKGPETGDDAKTRLQEAVQARLRLTPTYRIVRTAGPAHARSFTAEVVVGGRVLGEGTGASRKRAEQEAARSALREWA